MFFHRIHGLKNLALGSTFLLASGLFLANSTLASAKSMTLPLSKKDSQLLWTGYKGIGNFIKYSHNGKISVAGGKVELKNGKPVQAQVRVDMKSIVCLDLQGKPKSQKKLERHLRSPDFFAVGQHPFAMFQSTKITPMKAAGQYDVQGQMTIRGIKKPVRMTMQITKNGERWMAKAKTSLDRSQWNVMYQSPSLLKTIANPSAMADKLIKNEFDLELSLMTVPQTKTSKK